MLKITGTVKSKAREALLKASRTWETRPRAIGTFYEDGGICTMAAIYEAATGQKFVADDHSPAYRAATLAFEATVGTNVCRFNNDVKVTTDMVVAKLIEAAGHPSLN